ncbi:MAG TPA: MgtC/SapB family protein [Actinomycetota bacterium]|jgi:putative Mg2+ transporter-C (MgtC) family protein|nr:MgtC/SapB family protein [Actinomycetota bacterium]
MPTEGQLVLRLLLAAALAGALGVERELTGQPAGFRTHVLVGLGAALFAVVSAFGFQPILGLTTEPGARVDLSRVASQIVVGIGFLGGGAILKYGLSIRGLTTAASLWITAAVGTAVGIGALLIGTATTGIALVALVGLRPVRRAIQRRAPLQTEFVVEGDGRMDVAKMLGAFRPDQDLVRQVKVEDEYDRRQIRILVHLASDTEPARVAGTMTDDPHVESVDWTSES